jgi:hypothetical protein
VSQYKKTGYRPHTDPVWLIATARAEAARVRGWTSLGAHEEASAALDRAMARLGAAQALAPAWMLPAVLHARGELEAAIEAA